MSTSQIFDATNFDLLLSLLYPDSIICPIDEFEAISRWMYLNIDRCATQQDCNNNRNFNRAFSIVYSDNTLGHPWTVAYKASWEVWWGTYTTVPFESTLRKMGTLMLCKRPAISLGTLLQSYGFAGGGGGAVMFGPQLFGFVMTIDLSAETKENIRDTNVV